MDESYVLDVPSAVNGTATLRAPAVWGALRGLETLAQLVEYSPSSGRYLLRSAPWHIADRPQFAHRGLMIDTARHWLPVTAIKRQIDALAATKMNTLHWHATDAASFPLELQTFPRLAAAGAFSLGAAHRMTYSVAEQEEIVEHFEALEMLLNNEKGISKLVRAADGLKTKTKPHVWTEFEGMIRFQHSTF